jgi:hypothetical protein
VNSNGNDSLGTKFQSIFTAAGHDCPSPAKTGYATMSSKVLTPLQ